MTRLLPRIRGLIVNYLVGLLRTSSSKLVSSTILLVSSPFRRSHVVRRLVDEAQLNNPLKAASNLPNIELILAVARKDFRSASIAVQAALANSRNVISSVAIVVPQQALDEARTLFSSMNIIAEEDFLPTEFQQAISESSPPGREGWIRQQVIGLLYARESESPGVLVLDSDTILVNELTFLNAEGIQLLQFSHEYVRAYEEHAVKIWGRRRRHKGLSYVTHYQLMQPDVVRMMFKSSPEIIGWLNATDNTKNSPIADYHCYGRYLTDNFPRRVALGRWGNKKMTWDRFSSDFSAESQSLSKWADSSYYSVSVHSYLDKSKNKTLPT